MNHWSFLSNQGHILILLAEQPDSRLRDLAEKVGITERGVHRLIADMESAGVISRQRQGRRNFYSISREVVLRHPLGVYRTVGDLVDMVASHATSSQPGPDPSTNATLAKPWSPDSTRESQE